MADETASSSQHGTGAMNLDQKASMDKRMHTTLDDDVIDKAYLLYKTLSRKLDLAIENDSIHNLLGYQFINDGKSCYAEIVYNQVMTNYAVFNEQVKNVLCSYEYEFVRFVNATEQPFLDKTNPTEIQKGLSQSKNYGYK